LCFKAKVAVETGVIIGVPTGLIVAGIAVTVLFMFVFQNFRPVYTHHGPAVTSPILPQYTNTTPFQGQTNAQSTYTQMEMNAMKKKEYANKQEEETPKELRF
jgi:hypothetical protein